MKPSPPPCILIVDDDDDTRVALRILLEDAGYQVMEAPDGVLALEKLRASAARLVVLLDLLMPGMSGEQVLEVVADDGFLATYHTYILLTAVGAANAPPAAPLNELLLRLAIPRLAKPFDIDQLLQLADASAARLR
jgi:CheY-like chemotaxis protein